jgi:hypothetical protein
MNSKPLGRLEPVDLREAWLGEASDFTPWLAQEKNLELLGNTIALDLELVEVEKWVGPFRADIVCKETATNTWVLIENQLERTDHSHLGQLITYAAGLDAVTIVWVANRFTEEHRAALDWLNEVTDQGINFFGLEIELWRIGDSLYAPKLNVVSKPNDWIKTVTASRQAASGELSPATQLQLDWWTALREAVLARGISIKPQTPAAQNWYDFAIGRSGFVLRMSLNTRENRIILQLVMYDENSKRYFHLLQQDREAIDRDLGVAVEWRELPERKQSDLKIATGRFDLSNRAQWPEQHAWACDMLEIFYRALAHRVKVLVLADYLDDDEIAE